MFCKKFVYFIALFCHSVLSATISPPVIESIDNEQNYGPKFELEFTSVPNKKADMPTTTAESHILKLYPMNTESPASKSETDNDKDDAVVEDADFWRDVGIRTLEKNIKISQKNHEESYKRKAKNIIIFLGDGMGLTTVTAGRIYKGQFLKSSGGEEEMLSFDEFPNTGLAKTYAVDKQVPDSACTATALFCGVKTHYGAIGVDSTRSKTDSTKGQLQSFMDWAQAEGKRTGIVTTTRITHATPAATYARIYHRDWECDSKVPTESKAAHVDIARQLVENAPGNKFNVIMGGGLKPMGAMNVYETQKVQFEGDTEEVCARTDNRNLVHDWLNMENPKNETRSFVNSIDQLKKLDLEKVDKLLGLFRNNHISYAIVQEEGEPTLKEMTEAAIKVLHREDNPNGFVLLVEAGRIDQGHHQNYAKVALREVVELDKAVKAALDETDEDETLILVTADHSHAVTLNGYPARGNDILGFANKTDERLIYETITYANGPGYYEHLANKTYTDNFTFWIPFENMTKEERDAPTYRHMATMPNKDESHGGEDVIVYAHGPGSNLVRGVFEQNYLAYVMSYAGCMGPAKNVDKSCATTSGAGVKSISLIILVCSMICALLMKVRL